MRLCINSLTCRSLNRCSQHISTKREPSLLTTWLLRRLKYVMPLMLSQMPPNHDCYYMIIIIIILSTSPLPPLISSRVYMSINSFTSIPPSPLPSLHPSIHPSVRYSPIHPSLSLSLILLPVNVSFSLHWHTGIFSNFM